jgi:hypothetical protein
MMMIELKQRLSQNGAGVGATEAENDEAPDAWEESGDFALGLISTSMVELRGIEPSEMVSRHEIPTPPQQYEQRLISSRVASQPVLDR